MRASTGVKRLLIYALVAICVIFVGFLAYYFAKNNENIAFGLADGQVVYLNKDDTLALPLVHERKSKETEITVKITNPQVVTYVDSTYNFVATSGGMTSVEITTNNKHFGPYRFEIMVGDGTNENPYYITSGAQLAKIGTTNDWSLDKSYELVNEIDLANTYDTENDKWFTPIGTASNQFVGRFNGNGYAINGLVIRNNTANVGLFGVIGAEANVEGVRIVDAQINVTDSKNIGLVAGSNYGILSRVIVNGTIAIDNTTCLVGGIAGYSNSNISNASADVSVSGKFSLFGGITAKNVAGVLFNCKAVAKIDGQSSAKIGGIVAENSNTLSPFVRPIVKNCYAMIDEISVASGSTVGTLVCSDICSNNDYNLTNYYVSNYACCVVDGYDLCATKTFESTQMAAKTKNELKESSTYVDWDFDDIWVMNTYADLNIDAMVAYHGVYIAGSDYTSKTEIIDVLKQIIQNPQSTNTYNINPSEDIVIDCVTDLGLAEFKPIGLVPSGGMDVDYGFKGKFIVAEGKSLTIKNINISTSYYSAGFFSTIQDGVVSNVKFEDVTIIADEQSTKTTNFAGAICGKLIGATSQIKNCTVKNVKIKNYIVTGGICGYAKSSNIDNCNVSTTDTSTENNLLTFDEEILYYGGIVGFAENASLLNSSIDSTEIKTEYNSGSATMGGIVAKAIKSVVKNCYNNDCTLTSINAMEGYYGGVAGNITDSSKIVSCYSLAQISANINARNFVGGIAAVCLNGSAIQKSFASSIVLGKYVGGIVADNTGDISESYSEGEYTGIEVGGLAYKNTGNIANCYTVANLIGKGKGDYAVAGLVAYLPKGGNVTMCFSSANIKGDDCKTFAETSARIRYSSFANWLDSAAGFVVDTFGGEDLSYDPGTLTKCIVINYGKAEVQGKLLFSTANEKFIEWTDADVKGNTPNNPYQTLNYSDKIWNYGNSSYPTLVNVVTVANS